MKIRKFNESFKKEIDDYFIELVEDDLCTIETTGKVVNIYFIHDVSIKDTLIDNDRNDTYSDLDLDARSKICMREIEYFTILSKILDEIKKDYDIELRTSYDDLTHFTILYKKKTQIN